MADSVIETFPLGAQWPAVDPFLFCAHHLDHYPAGNGALAPAASLAGRPIGQDFVGADGWRMYHGSTVPGFPSHPHRGFETVTYVRTGLCDHSDSMGAEARFGRGDTQWMTAGSGVVHAEMFPLVDTDGANDLELFQIWLNLPPEDKLVDPYFTMLWAESTPVVTIGGGTAPATSVTVIAGAFGDTDAPTPPPNSWAARPDAEVAIWHGSSEPGAACTLPAAGAGVVRTLYVFDGDALTIDGATVAAGTGAVVACDRPLPLVGGDGGAEWLVLQGRPIGAPVAQYGPFVMNDRAQLEQAFRDYERTRFGGWPWDRPDPTHGTAPDRFARHADGRVETH